MTLSSVVGGSARAGLIYGVTESGHGLNSWHLIERVETDGTRFRIEYFPGEYEVGVYDLALSVDDGNHVDCVNTTDRTYFEATRPKAARGQRGTLPSSAPEYHVRLDGVEFRLVTAGPGPPIAGHGTDEYELTGGFQADVVAGQSTLRQLVRVEARVWVATDLPRRPLPVDPAALRPDSIRFSGSKVALDVIDRAMTANLATIDRQILRLDLKVTRRFRGSRPVEDTVSRQIDCWEDTAIDPDRFDLPHALQPVPAAGSAQDSIWR